MNTPNEPSEKTGVPEQMVQVPRSLLERVTEEDDIFYLETGKSLSKPLRKELDDLLEHHPPLSMSMFANRADYEAALKQSPATPTRTAEYGHG